jgi:hypothetical protein
MDLDQAPKGFIIGLNPDETRKSRVSAKLFRCADQRSITARIHKATILLLKTMSCTTAHLAAGPSSLVRLGANARSELANEKRENVPFPCAPGLFNTHETRQRPSRQTFNMTDLGAGHESRDHRH